MNLLGLFALLPLVAIVLLQLVQNQYSTEFSALCETLEEYERNITTGAANEVNRQNLFVPVGPSSCERLHAWYYPPLDGSDEMRPIVLISHGLGAQKDMGLSQYGELFQSMGYHALIFDYRTFGGTSFCCSESESGATDALRNHINPWHHVDDIKNVISWVKSGNLPSVDTSRIVLWGTSFSGGHALVVADQLGEGAIKAIISQVPHLDGKAASLRGMRQRGVLGSVKVAILAIADLVRSLMGMSPVYVKIAGKPSEVGYMSMTDEELKTYFSKHPSHYIGNWRNQAPARTMLMLSKYNPIRHVTGISAPILFIGATNDSLCPLKDVKKAFEQARNPTSRLLEKNCSHFDIYFGEIGKEAKSEMKRFLLDVL